jgi:hypothetical protein
VNNKATCDTHGTLKNTFTMLNLLTGCRFSTLDIHRLGFIKQEVLRRGNSLLSFDITRTT